MKNNEFIEKILNCDYDNYFCHVKIEDRGFYMFSYNGYFYDAITPEDKILTFTENQFIQYVNKLKNITKVFYDNK